MHADDLVGQGWSLADAQLIVRCHVVLCSPEFRRLKEAHTAHLALEIKVQGVTIIYEPSLPSVFSGMTQFGRDGFVIGPGAFASEIETEATVLQEMYRPATSVIGSTGQAEMGQVAEETKTDHHWAERAVGALQLK